MVGGQTQDTGEEVSKKIKRHDHALGMELARLARCFDVAADGFMM